MPYQNKFTRKPGDNGMSSISREFFEDLGITVVSYRTEGNTVIVETPRRLCRTEQEFAELRRKWRVYFEENRGRYDFFDHVLYPRGTEMIEVEPGKFRIREVKDVDENFAARNQSHINGLG